jgi:hypothetical protein
MIFGLWTAEQDRKKLQEANQRWDADQKADAVGMYKAIIERDGFHLSTEVERPIVYKRVIEYELEQGNAESAKSFVEKAFDKQVELPDGSKAMSELVAQVRADRQRREAEERARKEEGEKRKQEELKRQQEEARAERKKREEQNSKQNSPAVTRVPENGEIGYIEVQGLDSVWVPTSEKAQDEMHSFSRAKNEEAIRQMILQGRLLVCESRTKVSVVDRGFFSSTVRMMEGIHEGRTGIIANEFLHK